LIQGGIRTDPCHFGAFINLLLPTFPVPYAKCAAANGALDTGGMRYSGSDDVEPS